MTPSRNPYPGKSLFVGWHQGKVTLMAVRSRKLCPAAEPISASSFKKSHWSFSVQCHLKLLPG